MKKEKSLLILIFSLLLFGLVVITNATVISSTNLYNDPYKFALLQLVWVAVGLLSFFFFYKLDYRKLRKPSLIVFFINMAILLVLGIISVLPCDYNIPFSPCVNGANRWFFFNPSPLPKIPFLGVFGFQPGELSKLTLILFLAFTVSEMVAKKKNPFWLYIVSTGLMSLLILLQPNMSTAALVLMIGTAVYFSSGTALKEVFVMFPLFLAVGVLSIFISPYRRSRFLTLLGGGGDTTLDAGYHIKQVLLALGSGGFWGVGFGQSKQKFNYLPEVASDSIFAIIGEEFGFIGTSMVVIAFSYLVYLGFNIAKNCTDLTGKMIASGITFWLGFQFFINVGAMTKLLPLTGVPIPLISYGGSSIVICLSALGILANIKSQE